MRSGLLLFDEADDDEPAHQGGAQEQKHLGRAGQDEIEAGEIVHGFTREVVTVWRFSQASNCSGRMRMLLPMRM